MDIPAGLFRRSPREIAQRLRAAVLSSPRTRGTRFQSAMSMLNWFINRGRRGLSPTRRRTLEQAKNELRAAFGRRPKGRPG